MISASVITIGDEILYGQTLDTNSHFICGQMSDAGFKVVLKLSVGDNSKDIIEALKIAEKSADITLITGGLGPTRDDITKNTLAGYFNSTLKIDEEALKDVSSFFQRRGLALTEINKMQAALPDKCRKIRNSMGTAPGMWFNSGNKVIISMPGVPHEMENMLVREVLPELEKKYSVPVIFHKMIMTAGIGESFLSEMIESWENNLPSHMKLAYLPGFGQVKLRITAVSDHHRNVSGEVTEQVEKLEPIINKYIYGYDDISLEQCIGEILRENKWSIALAESCTGGHIAHKITTIPGSSDYFTGAVVAYQNIIKEKWLGVSHDTLKNLGAVSEETVKDMASSVRRKFKSSIGLASSGIAGPGGGSPEKPVGLVWVAIADDSGIVAKKFTFAKDRITNIQYATVAALTFLWQRLKQNTGIES